MSNKDSEKIQKPAPESPQKLSDLPPRDVSGEDGNLIKGGPSGHNWLKPST